MTEPATETACFVHEKGVILVTLLANGTLRIGIRPNDPARDSVAIELPSAEADIVRTMLNRYWEAPNT